MMRIRLIDLSLSASVLVCGCQSMSSLDRANAKIANLEAKLIEQEDLHRNSEQTVLSAKQESPNVRRRDEVINIMETRIDILKRENQRLREELVLASCQHAGNTHHPGILKVGFQTADISPSTLDQLAVLAKKYASLGFEFSSREPVLRCSSELIFAQADQLTKESRSALEELAKILNSGELADHNLAIVGHTFSERQVKDEWRKWYPTDWHLAAHQAISCAIYLEERGVKSDRLGITSYGSQQPLPNVVGNDDAARRKNARVEFWILQPDPTEDVSKKPVNSTPKQVP